MESLTIQKVIPQSKGYYRLLLSNGEEVHVHEDLLVKYRLLVGREIETGFLEEIAYEGVVQRGFSQAINYISYRPRSIREVEQYLARKEIDRDFIAVIVERLLEKNYLDDRQFAHLWVENRQRLKPRSKMALRQELQEKGIASDIIAGALGIIEPEAEIEQARQIGQKKMQQWRNIEWQKARPKLIRYLLYKGYDMSVISTILPSLRDEHDPLA